MVSATAFFPFGFTLATDICRSEVHCCSHWPKMAMVKQVTKENKRPWTKERRREKRERDLLAPSPSRAPIPCRDRQGLAEAPVAAAQSKATTTMRTATKMPFRCFYFFVFTLS
jgi:hypothetical protein